MSGLLLGTLNGSIYHYRDKRKKTIFEGFLSIHLQFMMTNGSPLVVHDSLSTILFLFPLPSLCIKLCFFANLAFLLLRFALSGEIMATTEQVAAVGLVPGLHRSEIMVCQYSERMNSQGSSWQGGDLFSFTMPVVFTQLIFIFIVTRTIFFILKPLKQSMITAYLIVSSVLIFLFVCFCPLDLLGF